MTRSCMTPSTFGESPRFRLARVFFRFLTPYFNPWHLLQLIKAPGTLLDRLCCERFSRISFDGFALPFPPLPPVRRVDLFCVRRLRFGSHRQPYKPSSGCYTRSELYKTKPDPVRSSSFQLPRSRGSSNRPFSSSSSTGSSLELSEESLELSH